MAKWVRGYRVCPNLTLTPCPGILSSLIGPSRGLVRCKQTDQQAATWLIIARWMGHSLILGRERERGGGGGRCLKEQPTCGTGGESKTVIYKNACTHRPGFISYINCETSSAVYNKLSNWFCGNAQLSLIPQHLKELTPVLKAFFHSSCQMTHWHLLCV